MHESAEDEIVRGEGRHFDEPSLTEILTSTTTDVTPWKCPKCPKSFISQAGLNMHNMRVHTKQILARGQKGWKPNPKARARKATYPSSDLETRRRKYRELRDRHRAMGLNAKGEPFKTTWGRAVSERMSKATTQGKMRWTPERTAKFRRTMRRKKRIQFVYPITEQIDEAVATPNTATTAAIRFCPHCGTNIERYL